MADDLFQPTIQDQRLPADPPWRPQSIIYPAFFGGPFAGTVLGLVNARRLALSTNAVLTIGATGAAAFAARAVFTALLDGRVAMRLLGSLAGLAVWAVVAAIQKRPFRAFEARDGEPASLVWPGLAAAIGCGLLEAFVLSVTVA